MLRLRCLNPGVVMLVALSLAIVGGGCSDDAGSNTDAATHPGDGSVDAERYPNQPGGDPLVPEVAALPYPSDFFLVADPTTKTGRRVAFVAEALPPQVPPKTINGADGFSRITPIVVFLPGSVDDATLPPADDPAATLKTSSPVLLVEAGTKTLVPILAENDLHAPIDAMRTLLIRPLRALKPKAGYVVILTNRLKNKAGEAHQANPAVRTLLDGTPTAVDAIERQRKAFVVVNQTIAKLGIAKEDVVLAWSFHTRSEEQVTGPLLSMQDQAMAWKLGPYTLDEDTVDADKNRQVVGSYTVPNFISPEGIIVLDDQGVPKQFGEKKTVLHLTIPDSIDGPRPIILYGHGFLGSSKEGTRGSYNKLCREHRFSSIGSFFGFNDQMTTKALTILTSDLGNVAQIDADVLQTFVNYTVLGRLVREKLAAEISKTVAGKTINPIDADRVYYMGISNGGTFGYVVAATQPKLSRAVMVVGGGGLVHFLQRSVVWNGYQPFIDVVFKENAINAQLAFAILQTGLDPIEPMNYVSRLVENRFPGRESMQAALHMAVNDSQVDNLVSEWVFRTAKVPMITPSPKPIWGVDTIIAPPPDGAPKGTKAALFVYDEHLLPSPPGNVPPPTDNHAHNSVRKLVAYETQVAEFLETGRFIQVCSGACDPD